MGIIIILNSILIPGPTGQLNVRRRKQSHAAGCLNGDRMKKYKKNYQ